VLNGAGWFPEACVQKQVGSGFPWAQQEHFAHGGGLQKSPSHDGVPAWQVQGGENFFTKLQQIILN
jgi:hypothetical protein